MTDEVDRVGVLFVCYANMCRSPLAEGVFRHLVEERGLGPRFEIDSAGTSALEGSMPHPLSVQVAEEHGIALSGIARQLVRTDLSRFDHILLMDAFNREQLRRMAGPAVFDPQSGLRARIRLLREVADPEGEELDVPDPITLELEGYEQAYGLILDGCLALLEEVVGAWGPGTTR